MSIEELMTAIEEEKLIYSVTGQINELRIVPIQLCRRTAMYIQKTWNNEFMINLDDERVMLGGLHFKINTDEINEFMKFIKCKG
jgi:hypothetical protein